MQWLLENWKKIAIIGLGELICMGNVVDKLINQLIINNIVPYNMKDEYKYALDKIVERTVSYLVIFIISVLFNIFLPTFIFLLCFCSLRGCTGGFHFNSYIKCLFSTIAIYIVFIISIYPWLYNNSEYLPYILIASVIIILLVGSINHPNMNWDENEEYEANKAARILLFLQGTCIFLCIELNINKTCLIFAIFGISLCAISLIIAKICRQEVSG